MPLNLKNFDLKGHLDEYSIEWRLPGHKNVGTACFVGVCCPFCTSIDSGFHCGIFNETFNFSCFRCGANGSLFDLLAKLTGIKYPEFFSLVKNSYINDPTPTSIKLRERFFPKKEVINNKYKSSIALPPRTKDIKAMESFLKFRGFSKKKAEYYKAYFCGVGKYKNRIILPIYNSIGQRVSFQARNLQRKKSKRILSYLNPGFSFGEHLYWLHKQKKNWILIVEGIFDRWRMGSNTVASFRNNLTQAQLLLLLQHDIRTVYIGWDADATIKSIKVAETISPLFKCVRVLILPAGEDPDSLGREKMFGLMESAEKI